MASHNVSKGTHEWLEEIVQLPTMPLSMTPFPLPRGVIAENGEM